MARTKIVVAVIAVVLIVILGLQNTKGVDATILFYTGTVPLAALLLLSFVAGVVAGLLIALAFWRSAEGHRKWYLTAAYGLRTYVGQLG
ncbi:MAG: lipopolysaccharide assembly protein LapA domain-containing protein [Planctomycetota bacterium]|jgi:uncharacterized integral membrane protein